MRTGSSSFGLVVVVTLLASAIASNAIAGSITHKAVKACEAVQKAPAVPVCESVKPLPPPPEVCKPVKPLPPPEVCKPVKACDGVDAHSKSVAAHDHFARFVSRFKKHGGETKEVDAESSQSTTPQTQPTPATTPAAAPQPPTT
jgi:hypothetical protein